MLRGAIQFTLLGFMFLLPIQSEAVATVRVKLDSLPKNVVPNKKRLPSNVILLPQGNKTQVIGIFDIEDYLLGVIPSEMPASWPVEALKAQVIASRTYALARVRVRKNELYHLESSVFDQVFKWKNPELSKVFRAKIKNTVDATKGEVLIDESGRVITTYFHADCGGKTEDPHHIWGGDSQFKRVNDHFCQIRKPWKVTKNFKEVSRLYERELLGEQIIGARIVSRSPSGRVLEFEFNGEKGSTVGVTGQGFRKRLGFKKIKSALFNIEVRGDQLTVFGRGFGHGAGLCQRGSRYLAEQGWDYKKILARYYPGSKLVRR